MVSEVREVMLSPYCWLCCCGGLPFLGLLKGLVCFIPCTLVLTISATIISLIWFIPNIYLSYQALIYTTQLGTNIKVILSILMILPIIVYPPVVLIVAFVASFVTSLGFPAYLTFTEDDILLSGFRKTLNLCCYEWVKWIWEFHAREYPEKASAFQHFDLGPGGVPFDIELIQIPFGIFFAIITILVDIPVITLISLFKFIPGCWRAYYLSWDEYLRTREKIWIFVAFPVFLIYNVILLPLLAIGVVVTIIMGIFYCPTITVRVVHEDGFNAGFLQILDHIYQFDDISSQYAWEGKSWLPSSWKYLSQKLHPWEHRPLY